MKFHLKRYPARNFNIQNDAIFERRCILQTFIFGIQMLNFMGVHCDASFLSRGIMVCDHLAIAGNPRISRIQEPTEKMVGSRWAPRL